MNERHARSLCLLLACAAALIFVLLIVTPKNIDPGQTDWVISGGGDNLQHYLGWRFFRSSSWTRYILFMRDLNYPVGTSVIVTDSNPLCCLIFKLFRHVLPENFQFNGIWILSSYLLLAYFAVLIGWRLTKRISLTLAGALIAILNPVILQRALIHENLTAHWLILAAIWLFLNEKDRRNPVGWLILGVLCLLIHIYFVPMLTFVLVLQMIRMIVKKMPPRQVLLPGLAFGVSLLAGYYLLGYSHILPQSGSYGELSMNLNAFIDPDGASSFLASRSSMPLQYEGFNYFGLGLLILAVVGLLAAGKSGIRRILPFLLPSAVLILLAASHEAYFDQTLLYKIHLSERLYSMLSVFRSSGRLVWPLYDLVLFASLFFIARSPRARGFLCGLAVFCALIQTADLKDSCGAAAERFRHPSNPPAEISEDILAAIPDMTHSLYVFGGDGKMADAFGLAAADHHWTYNRIANARGIRPVFGGDPVEPEHLTCADLDPDSVYIFADPGLMPDELKNCGTEISAVWLVRR